MKKLIIIFLFVLVFFVFIYLNTTKKSPTNTNKAIQSNKVIQSNTETQPNYTSSSNINQNDYNYPFGIATAFYTPYRKLNEGNKQHDFTFKSQNDNPAYSTLKDLGGKWDRTWDPVIGWQYVQKDFSMIKNHQYDWTIPDRYMKRVPSNIDMFVTIYLDRVGLKKGTWNFENKKIANAYFNFVKKAVERYDGDGINDMPGLKNKVKYWQIENEPSPILLMNRNSNLSMQQKLENGYLGFANLIKISSKAIKEADSEAKVISAGIVSLNETKQKKIINYFWKPIIEDLNGNYIDIFDIHWYGEWKKIDTVHNDIRNILDNNNFKDVEIWNTETAQTSIKSEKNQAKDVVRRFVYPLTIGFKKVFWCNLVEGIPPFKCKPADYTGLIYDGFCNNDLGYGVKKLAYYSLKLLNTKLKNSDWNNIQTIKNTNGIYIYKFTNKDTNQPIWVAWSDNLNNQSAITLSVGNINLVKITQTVPKYETGKEIKNFQTAFNVTTKKVEKGIVSITLDQIPVFIEEN